jgi:hypothetical protein
MDYWRTVADCDPVSFGRSLLTIPKNVLLHLQDRRISRESYQAASTELRLLGELLYPEDEGSTFL